MRSKGFTLIELLIVLVIIAIVSTIGLLSLKANENRKVKTFADELNQLISLVEEQALLRPAVLGLQINSHNFQFVIYKSDAKVEKKEPPWQLLDDDKLLGMHEIPEGVELKVVTADVNEDTSDDQADTPAPQIIFSTSGDITPFTIYVSLPGKEPRFLVRGDADGSITTKNLS